VSATSLAAPRTELVEPLRSRDAAIAGARPGTVTVLIRALIPRTPE